MSDGRDVALVIKMSTQYDENVCKQYMDNTLIIPKLVSNCQVHQLYKTTNPLFGMPLSYFKGQSIFTTTKTILIAPTYPDPIMNVSTLATSPNSTNRSLTMKVDGFEAPYTSVLYGSSVSPKGHTIHWFIYLLMYLNNDCNSVRQTKITKGQLLNLTNLALPNWLG